VTTAATTPQRAGRATPVAAAFTRTVFDVDRSAEYFTIAELQAQTGQPKTRFMTVVLKELLDNSLDACEAGGVAPVLTLDVAADGALTRLTIADNGPGIPADTVHRLLNFTTRTSDKAAYRSITRGAQGNALKTVLGIPFALGSTVPVVIEACGVRHTIRAWIGPAGELHVERSEDALPDCTGTRVTVTLSGVDQECSPQYWGRAFAAFNPHASVKISRSRSGAQLANTPARLEEDFYQSGVDFPAAWRKCVPTDPTSAWWYTEGELKRLIFSHIAETEQRGTPDLLLRDFVRQFRNLSSTAKAKAVCAHFPAITHLQDFLQHEAAVAPLLQVMRQEGKAPSVDTFGVVGEAHFRACFEAWYGVKRFWYRKRTGETAGVPFVIEAAVAETREAGDLWTGVNFSPTFGDPLDGTVLRGEKFVGSGVQNFLYRAHATGWGWDQTQIPTAAAVHIISPALAFLDRGKTRIQCHPTMAQQVAEALWGVSKDLYKEGEQRQKDAARAARAERERERKQERQSDDQPWTLKAAVFEVIIAAHAFATGNGEYPVSARNLFYQVRDRITPYTKADLDFGYFEQQLVPQYVREHGPLPGYYHDPRGVLYEPHTGTAVHLGTREVEAYRFPAWRYNKILYVEKKGLWPILEAAALAERHDMAIVVGEGYATEAIRVLFESAKKGQHYQIFALHDADPYGYNIARTLREETRRMPGYAVDVVDIGLRVADAVDLGLRPEEFSRKKALPEGLTLTALERAYFEGKGDYWGQGPWRCQRVELNALSAPQLIAYIEQGLTGAQAWGKVLPPPAVLVQEATQAWTRAFRVLVERRVHALVGLETLIDGVADRWEAPWDGADLQATIDQVFARRPTAQWEDGITQQVQARLQQDAADIARVVREALHRRVTDGLGEELDEDTSDDEAPEEDA
jgi:DNA topoisomerase VI subunit B